MAVFTNLFNNPRPVSGGPVGWSSVAGSGGVVSGSYITGAAGPTGGNARRVTFTTPPTNIAGGTTIGAATLPIAASPGLTYSLTVYVRPSKTQRMLARVTWMDATYTSLGTSIDSAGTVCPANVWTEVKLEGVVAIAGTANIRMQCLAMSGTSGVLWVAGDTVDFQAATIVEGATVPEPFHGSEAATGTKTYAWVGTTDASHSTLTTADAKVPPTDFVASAVSSSQIKLTWTPAPGYPVVDIDRDGVNLVSDYTGSSYDDVGLAPSTTHGYDIYSVG